MPVGPANQRVVRKRAGTEARGVLLWQQLKPALLLWIALLATNGLFGLIMALNDLDSPFIELLVTIVDAVIVCMFVCQDGQALKPLLQRLGFNDRTWWMAPAALGVFAVFMWIYMGVISWLGVEALRYSDEYIDHGWPIWSVFVLVAVCPGLFEELAFRGHIMERLGRVMKPKDALLVQAALFSVIHMSPLIFVSHFLMGVVFGVLRQRTGSLYPGMLLHMAWNALVLCEELLA